MLLRGKLKLYLGSVIEYKKEPVKFIAFSLIHFFVILLGFKIFFNSF
jgi:hypothetical protein